MMKYLFETWKEYLREDVGNYKKDINQGGLLPLDAIAFLVEKFSKDPDGLRYGYANFDELFGGDKELSNVAATYIASKHLLAINKNVVKDNFFGVVDLVLHEIQHFNQHYMWDRDDKFRMTWTKGKQLPQGFTPDDLYDLDFLKLISFWIKVYGYDRAPHEVEARAFGDKHAKKAALMILAREKELKMSRKDPNIGLRNVAE